MADEMAAVTLSAQDDISTPVLKAVASLQQLQAALGDISKASKDMTGVANGATAGTRSLSNAAAESVVPHHAAHQALALVSRGMADIAGVSPAAEGGVRVLDSVMFQMAATGGAVSLGFVALAAAAVGVGVAMRNSAEESKKQAEELDKITESATKAVAQLSYLDHIQKQVAGAGAAQLQERIIHLKESIAELTEKMKENAEATARGVAPSFGQTIMAGLSHPLSTGKESVSDQSAASQAKMAGQLRALQEELKKTQHEYEQMSQKASVYRSVLQNTSDPINEFITANQREAQTLADISSALGGLDADFAQLESIADRAGVTYVQAAEIMRTQTEAVKNGVVSLAQTMGTAMGNAIAGTKNAWLEGLKALIGAVFDAATQVVLAAAVMNKALSLALIPMSFGAILGLVVVLQAMKAVAIAALSSAASQAASQGAAAVSGSGGGGAAPVGGTAAASGPGGSAVSSAAKEVVNNISINLPVQALDLSAISDMQLKSLASRIGRVMAEAAGQGQFSLVGA